MESVGEYLRDIISRQKDILSPYVQDSHGEKPKRVLFNLVKSEVETFLGDSWRKSKYIIIHGLRGVGKTTLLAQLYFYLSEQARETDMNILYLSIDQAISNLKNSKFILHDILKEYLRTFYNDQSPTVLLLDEVQYDQKWGLGIKSILSKYPRGVLAVITGSSAVALVKDKDFKSTNGNYFNMPPLTFSEYLRIKYKPIGKEPPEEHAGTGSIIRKIFRDTDSREDFSELKSELKEVYTKYNEFFNQLDFSIENELELYLKYGGFPGHLELLSQGNNTHKILSNINMLLDKILDTDLKVLLRRECENEEEEEKKSEDDRDESDDKDDKSETKKGECIKKLLSEYYPISWDFLKKVAASQITSVDANKEQHILQSLKDLEVIIPVERYNDTKMKKRKKVYFISPTLRYSILTQQHSTHMKDEQIIGLLLEDGVSLYLKILSNFGFIDSFSYVSPKTPKNPKKQKNPDFVVEIKDTRVIIEVGRGNKGGDQVKSLIKNIPNSYGVVISKDEFKVQEDIIWIPKELFFLLL